VGFVGVTLLSFSIPFIVGLFLRKGHRWLLALGFLVVLVWWLAGVIVGGCDDDLEVACEWQSAFVAVLFTVYLLVPWTVGVGAAYAVRRRLRTRQL
jgi:hypothetical protein